MSAITTHILDVSLGMPAEGVTITLFRRETGKEWKELAAGATNRDGRQGDLLREDGLQVGVYRLRFEVGAYFERQGRESFYPHVDVVFRVADGEQHYHVPLLLSPYGYSTYRGS